MRSYEQTGTQRTCATSTQRGPAAPSFELESSDVPPSLFHPLAWLLFLRRLQTMALFRSTQSSEQILGAKRKVEGEFGNEVGF